MIQRRLLLWRIGVFLLLTGLVSCDAGKPPIVESVPPAVTVGQPVVRDVVNYEYYEGRIEAKPTVDVRARVRGHLFKIDFEDGQIVEKGKLLFEIDPRPYKAELEGAEAQKAAAEAALKLAVATAERDTRLAATGAVSRQELDVSLGKQGVSQAEVRKAQAAIDRVKLDLEYTKITTEITDRKSVV